MSNPPAETALVVITVDGLRGLLTDAKHMHSLVEKAIEANGVPVDPDHWLDWYAKYMFRRLAMEKGFTPNWEPVEFNDAQALHNQ